jgi:ATP-binding protein involved in chromosome partitioning
MTSSIDERAVRAALEEVKDPVFGKTLGELETLRELSVDGAQVRATIRLSTPAESVRAQVEDAVRSALSGAGVAPEDQRLTWDVQVPTRDVMDQDPVPDVRNVILVMSGKGGVGKSTVAVNLALALARMGSRVGLLDADMYGPSIPTMMGIQGRPRGTPDEKILPLERFGVKLMSIGFLLEDPRQAVVWRGPMLHGALQQFLRDVQWGELDYLLLDLPPGTGDVALTLSQQLKVTGAIMVTTPQEVALQDVYKGVSMCKRLNLPLLGVVENMSFFIDTAGVRHELFGSGGGAKVADFAEAPLLGQVPIEADVRRWGDEGTPIVRAAPTSGAGQAFMDIAGTLTEHVAKAHFARGGGDKAPAAQARKRLKIVKT